MTKIQEAQEILKTLGLPSSQYNEMSALTLLALCGIKEKDSWKDATCKSLGVSKGIMVFVNENYNKPYAANTRETFRRQVLHQFVQGRIADYNPDNPSLPVNSPNAHYAISIEALSVIKTYNTAKWKAAVKSFLAKVGKLTDVYVKERKLTQIPVKLSNGTTLKLSAGKHNQVQAAIIEQFAPRFAKNGILLYLGDTAKKDLYVDQKALKGLGIPIDQHSKLPDVVIYDATKKWLFLIEAVTSHGPVSPKRIVELEQLLEKCKVGKVYVTAFPDYAEFKKHISNIAWETEVWLMELPDHMIHFNGDRFMGPR
ncbi:MAG: hypothetical protein M0D57_13830 [Sphingobacteriales bacterium JAD_PAG50586_3]|nr:MAG: hypothetical protein M0D57_13830 [Sphingobacteriales bacterium JAD_PAG50586_3]